MRTQEIQLFIIFDSEDFGYLAQGPIPTDLPGDVVLLAAPVGGWWTPSWHVQHNPGCQVRQVYGKDAQRLVGNNPVAQPDEKPPTK